MKTKEQYEVTRRLRIAEGELAYSLDVFGDALATREGYKTVDGLNAVHLYLMNKHHWLPRDVRSMSPEDMRFALAEEMRGWTLPAAARPPRD
jgi:hypothetical protein